MEIRKFFKQIKKFKIKINVTKKKVLAILKINYSNYNLYSNYITEKYA